MEKKNEEFMADPLAYNDEVFGVGKVNGIIYKMVNYMREKTYEEQLVLFSAFLELMEEFSDGSEVCEN